jgi:hypothetical protein
VTLMLYFFDQFATSSLLALPRGSPDALFACIPEEDIIDVLLHPKRVLRLMEELPNMLMGDNRLSGERLQTLGRQFEAVSE